MKNISIGKLRGLQQISSQRGTFTALALDHRQNLRKANPAFVSDAELSRFKLDVTSTIASKATAVLLDPEVSAAQAIAQRAIPNNIGLVVAVESTGYTGDATARQSVVQAGTLRAIVRQEKTREDRVRCASSMDSRDANALLGERS